MKKISAFFRRGGAFLVTLCVLFVGLDMALTNSRVIEKSSLFNHNDFEKTLLAHEGATVYDKIFYGNSVVISSYVEWASDSGYANFGIDYGVMGDLRDMLERALALRGDRASLRAAVDRLRRLEANNSAVLRRLLAGGAEVSP